MKIQAALIAADRVYLDWLQSAANASVDLHFILAGSGSRRVREELSELKPELIFSEVGQHDDEVDELEQIHELFPQAALVAIGTRSPPELVIQLMRAGVQDFLLYGSNERELRQQLERILQRLPRQQDQRRGGGQIVGLINAVPDTGLAWAGEHLALALQEKVVPGERVLLVDAGMPFGASVVYLNASQSYSLLDAVQDVDRCDQTLVDTAFTQHASGLTVLTLPEDHVGPVALDSAPFLELLDVLSEYFRWVVVVAGGHLPLPALAGLTRRSHAQLILGDGGIVNSRANKHLLNALRLERCALDQMGLFVDLPSRRLGLEPSNLARLLDVPLWGVLGGHAGTRLNAMNAGETLFAHAPRDGYCADIRQLALRIRSENPAAMAEASAPGGLMARWFGR